MIIPNIWWLIVNSSSSKLPKFRKFTYTMNPSYSRPASLDPLFSQPVSLCVTCFTPVNWLSCGGKTFQLNLEIVWHHVNALCCSWNAMEPEWAKACPDKWASHFEDWRRRGFQNIVWLVCWMGWNPVKLQQPASALLNLGNCGPGSFSQGISGRAYSCGIALEGCHRSPEDSIALHTHTHRSSYSTKGIVYQKNLPRQQRTILEEKNEPEEVLFFSPFGDKNLWNMIIWNMGEIWVFPAFWRVAHTIVFHQILIL